MFQSNVCNGKRKISTAYSISSNRIILFVVCGIIIMNEFRVICLLNRSVINEAKKSFLVPQQASTRGIRSTFFIGANVTEWRQSISKKRIPRKMIELEAFSNAANFPISGMKTIRDVTVDITGLHCGNCASTCESIIKKSIDQIQDVQISLTTQTAQIKILDTQLGASVSATPDSSLEVLQSSLTAGGFPSEVVMEKRTQYDLIKGESAEFEDGCVSVSLLLEGLDSLEAVARIHKIVDDFQPLQTGLNIQDGTLSLVLSKGTDSEAVVQALEVRGFPMLRKTVEVVGETSSLTAMDAQRTQRISPLARFKRQELTVRRELRQGVFLLAASATAHLTHHLEEFSLAVSLPERLQGVISVLNGLTFLVATPFQACLATLSFLLPGRRIVMDGWQALFKRKDPNMNTLLSIGAVSSFASSVAALCFPNLGWGSHFSDPIMIFGFILVGQALEARARLRSARGLQKLFDLQVQRCMQVNEDKSITEVEVSSLPVGSVVRVLPGDRIPIDGVVVEGQSAVEEGLLTGESMPIAKRENDKVAAGTINIDGPLLIKATKLPSNSLLNQIIGMVEDAQSRQAPIQSIADRIAGKFCWGVLGAAGLTTLFWGTLGASLFPHAVGGGNPWVLATRLACDVMIVSCPCALGLATPIAILVGSGIAAEKGILIKGADILEKAKDVSTIVFDKTGTLTTGEPKVEKIIPLSDLQTENSLLEAAAAVEWGTSHPLARAVQSAAVERNIKTDQSMSTNYQTFPGLGASATVSGSHVAVGNVAFMDQENVEIDDRAHDVARSLGFEGCTPVYVAVGGQLVGLIGATDDLRPEAIDVMKSLKQQGVNVRLLTGDRTEVAQAIGRKLDLHPYEVIANVKPARKALTIKKLQNDGRVVAMIGDGINDAPALAQADVGIALRAGTDVAFRAADAVLMRNSLHEVEELRKVSKSTLEKVKSNLLLALGYNVIAIPLAAGVGLPFGGAALSPSHAAVMHSMVSLAVISNSIFLGQAVKNSAKP